MKDWVGKQGTGMDVQGNRAQTKKTYAYVKRITIYIAGMLLLAAGIILNTKVNMGVSPVVSVAFCISKLRGFSFSNMALALYLIYFVIEILLKWKDIRAVDFLQIPFCFVFTRCMDVISLLLPDPDRMAIRILMLAAGILITGFGSAIMINSRLIPNPADGLMKILSVRIHRSMGVTKNLFDAAVVILTIIVSLSASGRLIGVGVGTVCGMLGIGRAVALCNRLFKNRIENTVRQAPIRIFDGSEQDNAS